MLAALLLSALVILGALLLVNGPKNTIALMIVYCWWCFWLIFSAIGLSGLEQPKPEFFLAPFVLLTSAAVVFYISSRGRIHVATAKNFSAKRNSLDRFIFLIAVVIALGLLPLLVKAWALRGSYGDDLSSYRSDALGSNQGASVLFPSATAQLFYQIIVMPIIYFIVYYGCVHYFFFREKKLIGIAVLLLIFDAAINFGRTGIYQLVILVAAITIVKRRAEKVQHVQMRKGRNIGIILIASLFFAALIYFTKDRLYGDNDFVAILTHLIDYHIVGFSLFGREFSAPNSFLNNNVFFGGASISALEEYFSLIYRLVFDSHHISLKQTIGTQLNEYINLGVGSSGADLMYNAYYTVMYSLFIDFRWFGLLVGGALWGYYLAKFSRAWIMRNCFWSAIKTNALIFVGMFSIFASPLEGPRFWAPFILVLIFQKISKIRLSRIR